MLVVGPSGAGKDSVLRESERFASRVTGAWCFRGASLRGWPIRSAEDHVSITEMEFAIAVDDEAFALWWRAHGNCYGIGRSIEGDLAAGVVWW